MAGYKLLCFVIFNFCRHKSYNLTPFSRQSLQDMQKEGSTGSYVVSNKQQLD